MRSREGEGGVLGTLTLLLLGLGCGGVVALSPDISLPLAVLLLPGLIYLVVDRSPGWGIARAILLFQVAACVHPVSDAWYQCAGMDACMTLLGTPTTLMPIWLIGGLGWLITQVLPIGLRLLNDLRISHYRVVLEKRRAALTLEWGLEKFPTD